MQNQLNRQRNKKKYNHLPRRARMAQVRREDLDGRAHNNDPISRILFNENCSHWGAQKTVRRGLEQETEKRHNTSHQPITKAAYERQEKD